MKTLHLKAIKTRCKLVINSLNKKKNKILASFILLMLIISIPLILNDQPPVTIAQADGASTVATETPDPSPSPIFSSTPEPAKTKIEQSLTPKKSATQVPQKISRSDAPESYNNNSSKAEPKSTTQPTEEKTKESISTPVPTPEPTGILGYINEVRSQSNLTTLSYNAMLNSAAKSKSEDMNNKNYFAHTNPDGKTDFDFIRDAGYIFSYAGSNLAQGNFSSEKGLFDAWMNSPGHRANILDSRAREFGFGSAGSYFTMMVGARQ